MTDSRSSRSSASNMVPMLQSRGSTISERDQRHEFGFTLIPPLCKRCKKITRNRGCQQCNTVFCSACFLIHDVTEHGNFQGDTNSSNLQDYAVSAVSAENKKLQERILELERAKTDEVQALQAENATLQQRIQQLERSSQARRQTNDDIDTVDHPLFGDEVEALPGSELNIGGKDYYTVGDKGRVSKDRYQDTYDGIERFEITWYRTGERSTMKSDCWLRSFRFCGKGRHPKLGDEMIVLPTVSFTYDDIEYYVTGDRGRVSKDKFDDYGTDKFEVTWYRTGRTSTMKSDCWPDNFRYALRNEEVGQRGPRNSFAQFNLLDTNRDGVLSPDEFEAALETGKLNTGSDDKQKIVPTVGDEMRCLPNVTLVVGDKEYYKGGDKGRVSKDEYVTASDGIRRFEVTWYRTGLTSTMKTQYWLKYFQFLGKGKEPVMGDEVLCLPNVELVVDNKEYYRSGDKGRVSKDNYIEPKDGIQRFEVTWYRTGLTSTMKTAMWHKNFRLLDTQSENKTIEELRIELASVREKLAKGGSEGMLVSKKYPELGDEVEVLPNVEFSVEGEDYYKPHDKGRVSKDRYIDENDNIERFEVSWYRTGLTSTMKSQMWLKNFRLCATKQVKLPVMGDEVQSLPLSELIVEDTEYYVGGDRGRVSKDKYTDANDGIERFEVTWYRTGRTSTMKCEAWLANFKLVQDETVLIDDEQRRIIGEAVEGTDVLSGKPVDLVTGQPKSAAMGLYHFMRVKDPFAEEGTTKLEEEIRRFVRKIQDNAILVTLVKNTDAAKYGEVVDVYGEPRITEADQEIAYFRKAARLDQATSALDVAQKVKEELLDSLIYILREVTSEKFIEGCNAIRDRGRVGKRLEDFMQHANVKDAELTKAHVASLRLYTSSAYKYINSPMRSQADYYDKKKSHPLPLTVAYIAEGIKKLRAAYSVKVENNKGSDGKLVLWRGLRNMNMANEFLKNRKGGTELAPMSTTSDLMVAAKYAGSGDSIIFKIQLDNFMQYGAELSWLSCFPAEDEILYPPLTYLQPTLKPPQTLELSSGHRFTVYEVKPTIP